MKFIRERRVKQGKRYLDVDLVTYTTEQERRLPKRSKREITVEKIRRQNHKNQERSLRQIINANFDDTDYFAAFTYAQQPPDRETAKKDINRYLERLRRLYKKRGVKLKYIVVTGGGREKEKGEGLTRLHHHVVIGSAGGAVTRDEIEAMWKEGRRFCGMLQAGDEGYGSLAHYLAKRHRKDMETGEHLYRSSRNLIHPVETREDGKFSEQDVRKLERLKKDEGNIRRAFERLYRGWECVEVDTSRCEVTGWTNFYAKLRRKE